MGRMEFVSEEEAREYLESQIKKEDVAFTDWGVAINLKDNNHSKICNWTAEDCEDCEDEMWFVYTHLGKGKYLYLYDKSASVKYGYEQQLAKKFPSKNKASKVASMMTQNGTKTWSIQKQNRLY